MKKTLIGLMISLLAAIGILLAAPAQAYPYWQAIFYSPGTGWVGFARDYPTSTSAAAEALSQCSMYAYDCQFAALGTGYVALAVGPVIWWGGVGPTAAAAISDAVINSGGGTVVKIVGP